MNIPRAFGGPDEDTCIWILRDAPTLLYSLLAMGLGDDNRVQQAVDHLAGLGVAHPQARERSLSPIA